MCVCVCVRSRPNAPPGPAYNDRFGLPRTRVHRPQYGGVVAKYISYIYCVISVSNYIYKAIWSAGGVLLYTVRKEGFKAKGCTIIYMYAGSRHVLPYDYVRTGRH